MNDDVSQDEMIEILNFESGKYERVDKLKELLNDFNENSSVPEDSMIAYLSEKGVDVADEVGVLLIEKTTVDSLAIIQDIMLSTMQTLNKQDYEQWVYDLFLVIAKNYNGYDRMRRIMERGV